MSLYHEAAAILDKVTSEGGSLKSRVFGPKNLKSPPAQVYALALESCKWSRVLKEVIENAQLLHHERKLSPILSLLLVHDLLLAKKGIALPASHGLRASVERHKARLASELTRARIRRKFSTLDALKAEVQKEAASPEVAAGHPRWVRVNTLKSSLSAELETSFLQYTRVDSVQDVVTPTGSDGGDPKRIYVDEQVPNLVAISPGSDIIKTEAYKSGRIILQDKASCFPAYLLNPGPDDGDVIDSCAAPGNKTTHLAAILKLRVAGDSGSVAPPFRQTIHAFEKDENRAKTLEKMVRIAGCDGFTLLNKGSDFLKADPASDLYKNVGALLLDPSCSGSGIVGRDDGDMPELHLPDAPGATTTTSGSSSSSSSKKSQTIPTKSGATRKRKRGDDGEPPQHNQKQTQGEKEQESRTLVDDDGQTTVASSQNDLRSRLASLAAFQLSLLLHALSFPRARKVTYSTCSVHAEENEHVVFRALASDVARRRGWRVMRREEQVSGMRDWPVRGRLCGGGDGGGDDDNGGSGATCEVCRRGGDAAVVAEACIRTYKSDGRGVMGFFVTGFVRDGGNDDDDGIKGEGGRPVNVMSAIAEGDGERESDWEGFDD